MNKLQEKVRNALSTLANNMVNKDPREWPPQCLFLTYQPMRPETKPEEKAASAEK